MLTLHPSCVSDRHNKKDINLIEHYPKNIPTNAAV